MRKIVGGLFVFGAIVLFLQNFNLTGAVIGVGGESILPLIYLPLFLIGLFLLISHQKLEAIVIPTGWNLKVDPQRAERALKEYNKYSSENKPYLVISGVMEREYDGKPKRESQVNTIYKYLIDHNVPRQNIIAETKSRNTEENILYTEKKLAQKGIKRVGIASDAEHLGRFKYLISEFKKSGDVRRELRMAPLKTEYHDIPFKDKAKYILLYPVSKLKDYISMRSRK